jgi:hypothetical protein
VKKCRSLILAKKFGVINRGKGNGSKIYNRESEKSTLIGGPSEETSVGSANLQIEQPILNDGTNDEPYDAARANHVSEKSSLIGGPSEETSVGSANLQIEQPILNDGTNDEPYDAARANHVSEKSSLIGGPSEETSGVNANHQSVQPTLNDCTNNVTNGCGIVDFDQNDGLDDSIAGGSDSFSDEEEEAKKWYKQNFNRSPE